MFGTRTFVGVMVISMVLLGPRAAKTQGENIYWVGWQHLFPDGCQTNHSNGHFADGTCWYGYVPPGGSDVAVFGSGFDPQENGLSPYYLHFGDFCVYHPSCPGGEFLIEAVNPSNTRLDIESGSWTFDFGPGSHPFGSCLPAEPASGSYTANDIWIGTIVETTGLPGTASLTVRGPGQLSASNWLNVGAEGDGTFIIEDGASVTGVGSHIASQPGSTGEVTVSGPETAWTLSYHILVGNWGPGELTIQNGAHFSTGWADLAEFEPGSGIVTVTGSGSRWHNTGFLRIGLRNWGSFNVLAGGEATNDGWCGVGTGSSGVGEIVVSDSGSSLTCSGGLTVPGDGRGTLTIANAGTLGCGSATIGGREGSIGEATVSGTETAWTVAQQVVVGDQGGSGTLVIQEGGQVSSADEGVGLGSGSAGSVTVDGPGSAWVDVDGGCCQTVGGSGGGGTVEITNGGSVDAPLRYIGSGGGTGTIVVQGSGSRWTTPDGVSLGTDSGTGSLTIDNAQVSAGDFFDVGGFPNGHGTLTVRNGGTLGCARASIGDRDGSIGEATVSGIGSSWTVSQQVVVGDQSGSGTLVIQEGGQVSSADEGVGLGSGSAGSVTVDGPGSAWVDVDGGCCQTVGGSGGVGTVEITDGGSVDAPLRYIGSGGGTGTIVVQGSGSRWTTPDELWLADGGGTASLTIDGGEVSVASFLYVGAYGTGHGSVTVENGGTLSTFDGTIPRDNCVGDVTVTGPASTRTMTGGLWVGLSGQGTLTIEDGGIVQAEDVYVGANGTLNGSVITLGGTPRAKMSAPGLNSNTLQIQQGGLVSADSVAVEIGALLSGEGEVRANVTNAGTVRPGDEYCAPGILSITGDYTQQPDGNLDIQLGGSTAGDGFDLLAVTGTVALQGTLSLSLINGFRPVLGEQFSILTASSVSGQFAEVTFPPCGEYEVIYEGGAVVVAVVTPPAPGQTGCDACGCFLSSPVVAERLALPGSPISKKIRYLSFTAGEAGRSQAIRVTFQNVPAPYAHWNGTQLWVQEPKRYCENAGQKTAPSPSSPPNYGCGSSGGISPVWFWGADLGCDAYFGDWTTYGVVHVWNQGVIPLGVYDVQVLDETCSPDNEASYSTALTVTESRWADLIKDCTTNPCGPPDGSTGISTDVTAILDKWKNLPGNVGKARADIEGSPAGDHRLPDQAVNITDVTYCLGAFLGQTYPPPGFPGPGSPPSCGR